MGGRRGPILSNVVGNIRIGSEKKELIDSIKQNNPENVVKSSVKIIAKSSKALDFLAYGYLFVDSIKNEYKKLTAEDTKERRKTLSQKWAEYRKKTGKKFDSAESRNVVDSATRVLGGGK